MSAASVSVGHCNMIGRRYPGIDLSTRKSPVSLSSDESVGQISTLISDVSFDTITYDTSVVVTLVLLFCELMIVCRYF